MRLVDEITERPASRALPAPTGPRAVTGSVPVTSPALFLPTLPASAPKAAGPVTSQLAATAAAQFFQTAGIVPAAAAPAPRPKRRRKVVTTLAVVVALAIMLAIVFRNSAVVERFTGRGYDTNPLPTHPIPQPPFAGAEYTLTSQSIAMANNLPTNYWRTERDEVNYTAKVAKVTVDRAKATVIGGTIGTPQSTSPPTDAVVDEHSMYLPGALQTDPWTRQPHEAGWSLLALLSPHELLMYQDVIDPALRSQHPKSVAGDTRHEIPVTTYTYAFAFGKFYESAPRLFEMVKLMDGNAAADAMVTVTISLDEQWMVRYLDVNVDIQAVLEYKAERDVETPYPYRYTFDVVSITDAPPDIAAPVNTVDATSTTTTTPPLVP
jgi:hypothetical protein